MTDQQPPDGGAAGTLAPRSLLSNARWKIAVWVAVAALLLASVLTYLFSVHVRLSVVGAQTRADSRDRTFGQSYDVRNDSPVTLHLIAATTHVHGIAVTGTNVPAHGLTVPPHRTVTINTRYQVTDCHKPPAGPLPVRLSIDRWWGTQIVTVQDHGLDYDDAWTASRR
jgi:hypothetical protein